MHEHIEDAFMEVEREHEVTKERQRDATLVVAARACDLMEQEIGSNGTYFSKYNRPIEPSGPNPCSYPRGPGHCQPPKCKKSLSLRAKAIFHLLLILVGEANLVDAARPHSPMNKMPKFGASTARFPESNRPIQPSVYQTMISMCKKSLFLGSKATILLVLLILASSATLVMIATRPSSLMTEKPKFGASSMYFPQSNRPLIKTMVSSGGKRSLFLRARAIFLMFLILVARAPLVAATRPSNTMNKRPDFRAPSTYYPQSNRTVQPSGPNPCSYIPGPGECKPPNDMCKRSLFPTAKAIFLVFLILVARAPLVAATRPSNTMNKGPEFRAASTYYPQSNRPLIKTMVSSGGKRSLFLRAKAIFLVFLILVARAPLVAATRPSHTMSKRPDFRAPSTYYPQSNRPVQPSAPNPCSYIPGPGVSKPPK
ncbi:hypothetical protein SADUNF_Sadunf06G0210300 [Salix dunnii]|uniref:Uncharacterized protein n=1 Tax=Salix dunnii TaxID=1413687 RepID=A0A835MY55_9ROSI|nr:hypothetical protein SADUNF_Sadunf06G0210300 [Salix dunnii]